MVRLLAVVLLVAGCFSPHPQPGSPCPDGFCANGLVCDPNSVTCLPPQDVCPLGETMCSGACVDPSSDVAHCGGCDACALANATAACVDGTCQLVACVPGACVVNNACVVVDTTSDPANCGSCGNKCSSGTCSGGSCALRAFVTIGAYSANLGGLDGGDAKCQAEADAHMLGGRWRAWLADSAGSPSTRFTHGTSPYLRLDGVQIAPNWTKLTSGMLQHPVLLQADRKVAVNVKCWSDVGAGGGGAGQGNCSGWSVTTTTVLGGYGEDNSVSVTWTNASTQSCDPTSAAPLALYCFEQ